MYMIRSLLVFISSLHAAQAVSFAVIGDWGRGGAHHQRQVGDTLRRQDISFVISTGDNFYPRGITSTFDDNLLQWEEVYQPRIPWYLALGNHDHRGNVSAQTALTDVMTFWNMPTTYYDAVVQGIHFFFLDTSPWVYGEDVDAQGEWITSQYASSNALRKFIVGHHPLWTCGYHHDRDDVSRLRATLIPLLQKHGGVYLSGHDHNMQHIVKDGVQQFISGAGAFNYQVKPCDGLAYGNGNDAGFLRVDDNSFTFIDRHGAALYSANL